ncbi:hypothetical protein EVAR_61234_1 [Eumeta japonica]|uniref:RNase H type-1 domain-containing protein n=1 Tax=Eumeta variegata TaxID=151549 RepID=A0A4C1Z7F9_EUMVA|nr:hypothetical protein EVAR_61234_1 [Eumeta japonica]
MRPLPNGETKRRPGTYRYDSIPSAWRVKKGKDGLVNVFSDSRSALEVLTALEPAITSCFAESNPVSFSTITGNEHVDELARHAALTKKKVVGCDKFSLSYTKKMIGAASLENYQNRYAEGSTGEVIKCLFPQTELAYQEVLLVFEEYPMFLRDHVALEAEIDVVFGRQNFADIMEDDMTTVKFLRFCDKVINQCLRLNKN